MNALLGVGVALIAIVAAMRLARAQGVPALPLLGWSLLLAVAVSAVAVGGALAAFNWCTSKPAQVALIFTSVVAGVAVGIWLSRLVWRRLTHRAKSP